MLKTSRFIAMFAACVVVALVTVLPAGANDKPVTGTRIGLFAAPSTFAANTPFYIEQGFACQLADSVCMSTQIGGQASFALYLDGVLQTSTVDVDVANGVIRRANLTNFGSGLSGTHTFLGVWTLAGVQNQSTSVTITFS